MRRHFKNQPPIEELTAADPALAAAIAAIRFEGEEQECYDRQHSIVCRHFGLFIWTAMIMAFGPVFAIVALAGRVDFGSPGGLGLLWKLMATSATGFLLVLFCFARPGSRSWLTAWGKVLLVVAMFMAIAIPMIGGFDALMNLITG